MQTWKTEILPDKWKSTQTSIAAHMPGWDYVLMTDEMNRSFIQEHFPDFLPYFDEFPYPIQRADAIRYAWMYVVGGLYMDCDFEVLSALDELFTADADLFLLESSNVEGVITNAFMAAKPRNRVFLSMLEEMKAPPGLFALEKHLLVMNTTGPSAFTRAVKKSGEEYVLLPKDKINPYTLCERVYHREGVLLKPLEGSSWVGGMGFFYQWCFCKYRYIISVAAVVVMILLSAYIIAS